MTGHPITAICRRLGMARQTAYHVLRPRRAGSYRRTDDETVLQQIRAVTNGRATPGYRRVWTMVNRTFRTGYRRKRIRRVMRLHGLMLAPRVHRRHGRPHLGQVQQPASNQRWGSDVCLIPRWSGEVLSVAFASDCHDREVPAGWRPRDRWPAPTFGRSWSAWSGPDSGRRRCTRPTRFGGSPTNAPQYPAMATVLHAHELGLVPITTPAYSPESNGLAEAFIKTFKRDYVAGAELRDAGRVPGDPRSHAPICLHAPAWAPRCCKEGS